jgi:hypothetical protein
MAEASLQMGASPDSSWLVDMMITIMHAKTWNEPLTAFISEKCIGFDNFEEENKHEYIEVHNQFKSLVDNLLAAHLLEVDIMPEEFERQLEESGLLQDPRLQQVVGQLMAAEDFITFKTMMIERHMNMQQQAESNYRELANAEDVAAAQEIATAHAFAASEAAARGMPVPPAPAAAPMQSYAPATATATTMHASSTGDVAVPPSMQQERAFGAGGGFYGRATMPGANQAPPSKEKANAIKAALCGALRRPR